MELTKQEFIDKGKQLLTDFGYNLDEDERKIWSKASTQIVYLSFSNTGNPFFRFFLSNYSTCFYWLNGCYLIMKSHTMSSALDHDFFWAEFRKFAAI